MLLKNSVSCNSLEKDALADLFQTWHNYQQYIGHSKNCNKKMGSLRLFSPCVPVILSVFSYLHGKIVWCETQTSKIPMI